jgi:hypothetical protein
MATYIPGIESYTPEYTPFEPDFKFAQAVLSTRQDRYDTNYKQLNDLYGSVIYADLSREDTRQQRDNFAEKLVPAIHKIADMDLSIGANVDAAKGVFNPFIENNLIQQDIFRTSKYKGELQRAQSLLNAPNPDASKQYWQTGIEYMNYMMDDFINASPEEAIRKPLPEYVPNANLYDMALDYLKESGIEAEDFYFTKDKKFIIKQTNGELIYDASYDRVKRALAQNGQVQRAYAADGYVQARKYAEQGIQGGKFSTINEGRVAWAQNTLADINFKATQLQLAQEGKLKELEELKLKHEKKINDVGEENLSPMEKRSYDEVLRNLSEVEEETKQNRELVSYMGNMTADEESLLNRAYGSLMNWNISEDLRAAAMSYSMEGAKRDIEINDYQRDIEKHNLQMIRDAAQRAFQKEENRKDRLNRLEAAGMLTDPSVKNALDGFTTVDGQVSYVADEEGKPNADADIYDMTVNELELSGKKVLNDQINTILGYHQKDQAGLGVKGTPESIVIPTEDGDKVFTINEARTILQKPEHQAFVQDKYNKISTILSDPEKRVKEAPHISDQDAVQFKNMINQTKGLAQRIERTKQEFDNRAAANWDRVKTFENLAGVPQVLEDIEYGAPDIVQNGKVLSKEEYIKLAVQKARNKEFIDRVRLDEPFYDPVRETTMMGEYYVDVEVVGEKFNEEWARESAEAAYVKQKALLNRTLNGFFNYDTSVGDPKGKVEDSQFQAFGVYSMLRGGSPNLMTDETAFMANTYSTGAVSPRRINNMSQEEKFVLVDFINQLKTGGVQYIPGDVADLTQEEVKDLSDEDVKAAQRIVGQSVMDLSTGISADDKKGLFNVTYIDAYGTKDSDVKTGAYVVTFDQTALNKSIGLSGDDAAGTGTITKEEKKKFSTITIMVNDDQDVSGYSQNSYNYNAVDTDIDFNGSYVREIPGAGSFKIWKDGNQYLTTIEELSYDPTASTDDNYVRTTSGVVPMTYPKSYGNRFGQPVTAADIQQIADYMEFVKFKSVLDANVAAKAKR